MFWPMTRRSVANKRQDFCPAVFMRLMVDERQTMSIEMAYDREGELGVRAPNLQNHHLCHRCNDYCAKRKKHSRPFNETKDKDVPDEDCYTDRTL